MSFVCRIKEKKETSRTIWFGKRSWRKPCKPAV